MTKRHRFRSRARVAAAVSALAALGCSGDSKPAKNLAARSHALTQPTAFDVVKVDDVVTAYATFQSHLQKVVENQYGIFMTYIYSTEPSAHGTWRLVRSIDRGKSW